MSHWFFVLDDGAAASRSGSEGFDSAVNKLGGTNQGEGRCCHKCDHGPASCVEFCREVQADEQATQADNLCPNQASTKASADQLGRGRWGHKECGDQQRTNQLDHAHNNGAYRHAKPELDGNVLECLAFLQRRCQW